MPNGDPSTEVFGYPTFQIAKALFTAETHADADTRQRADEKIARWLKVIGGIESGAIRVGSRTPVANAPAWASLEVVTGGFATGELLAGGESLPYERELIKRVAPGATGVDARVLLNSYFLTDAGIAELSEMLASGAYRINVPEEGALLTIAWLLDHGHASTARELIAELGGHFHRLRFYPEPAETLQRYGTKVFLENVGQVSQRLKRLQDKSDILKQREAVKIWTPLCDRFLELFCETVEGELPTLHLDDCGKPIRENGSFIVQGGWPCQNVPEDWNERIRTELAEYQRLRAIHHLCKKPDRKNGHFSQLRTLAARLIAHPAELSGKEIARIRLIVAGWISKYGTPNSDRYLERRSAQTSHATAPTHKEISERIVVPRLKNFPEKDGLDNTEALAAPVMEDESGNTGLAAGLATPFAIRRRLERALRGTVGDLIANGIITSGDTLARLLPQMNSGLRSGGIRDLNLRNLYSAIYRAFRKRRSLLLLDLQKQVQLAELSWVAAIESFREINLSDKEISRRALEEVASLTLTAFPQAIFPNKLVQEMRALAEGADIDLVLVDEIAADIFMGEFSPKFTRSAKVAASLLADTLYARYYDIDFAAILKLPETIPPRLSLNRFRHSRSSNALAKLCAERAGTAVGGWDTVNSGLILEQQQILTTQNLAAVFSALGLRESLSGQLGGMARDCFDWICSRHRMKIDNRHAKLVMLKNTAYAWRQMLFYLSLAPNPEKQAQRIIERSKENLESKEPGLLLRLQTALDGLKAAACGARIPREQQFLGWTKGHHWLLPEENERKNSTR